MRIRKLLFPTDFSEEAQAALPLAISLALDAQAVLVIVHVDEPESMFGTSLAPEFSSLDAAARSQPQLLLEKIDPLELRTEKELLLDGPVAGRIVEYAEQHREIDLIVMSTHGRSGLSRLLMGSVAEAIVRSSPCPVMTLSNHARRYVSQLKAARD